MPRADQPMHLTLDAPLLSIDASVARRRVGRVKGPEAHDVLAEAFDIRSVGQLLHHYPRRYIDRSKVSAIRSLRVGQYATVIARVRSVEKRLTRQRRQSMVTVTLTDGTGYLDLAFFNQPWAASIYREGLEVAVSGIATMYRGRLQFANQEVEVLRGDDRDLVHTARITPVHPASEGVSPRTIRELVHRALERLPHQPDPLPRDLVGPEHLSDWDSAIRHIHFPADDRDLASARERLKFDELFTLGLGVAFRKQRVEMERPGFVHDPEGALTDRLRTGLPFEPTGAQRRAMDEVGRAMAAPRPMNLLLQGDVGSGKTLVALHACLVAIQSGHQAAIMAPTEVLAGQHARSVGALLGDVGGVAFLEDQAGSRDQGSLFEQPGPQPGAAEAPPVTYALLSAAVTGKDRQRVLDGVADGSIDLVVGTHALVQEGVSFADLSVAVID